MIDHASEGGDRYVQLLAEFDEALALGGAEAAEAVTEPVEEADLGLRLRDAKECLKLLEEIWPRGGSTAGRRGSTDGSDQVGRTWAGDGATGALPLGGMGDFRLLRVLGRGGMGVVYEAEQLSLGRRVALKMLPWSSLLEPKHRQRFRNEARAAAALDHPHIVKIHAVSSDGQVPYYAMQLIAGRSLAEWIAQWRADGAPPDFYRLAARLGVQACEALEHAHGQGVIHRDVKPANLLVSEERHLWVADFGLARVGTDPGVTATGDMLGTLRYMSPEQALGRRVVDHRTDLYSLGVTLYELTTLAPMFPETERESLLHAIVHEAPHPPRRVAPGMPRDLETIILKATAKEPGERYESARQMADDLRSFLEHKPIRARRPSLLDQTVKWMRRNGVTLTASLATAALVLVAALGLVWRQWHRAEESARRESRVNEELRERNYVRDMQLASQAWWQGGARRVLQLLDKHLPGPEEKDLRGFEWHFLRRQSQPETIAVQASPEALYFVTHSPDGRWVAVAGKDAVVRVYDASTGEARFAIPTGQIEVNGVAFSRDGRTLASAGDDGTVRLWDVPSRNERLKIEAHPDKAYQLAFSPDGAQLHTCGNEPVVRTWDTQDGVLLNASDIGGVVANIALSPDGQLLAAVNDDGLAIVWEVATEAIRHFKRTPAGEGACVAFSPDGRLWAAGFLSGTIYAWDVERGTQLQRVVHSLGVLSVTFSPDGKQFVITDEEGGVSVHPADNGLIPAGALDPPAWAGLTPDQRSLVVATETRIRFHDLATGEGQDFLPDDLRGLATYARGAAEAQSKPVFGLSPDGAWFACGAEIYRADPTHPQGWRKQSDLDRLGPANTLASGGMVLTDFFGGAEAAAGVAVQPDGRMVVAGNAQVNGKIQFAVARYNPDGSLDTTFDGDGLVVTPINDNDNNLGGDYAIGVALQPDGKIVVAGLSGTSSGNRAFGVARYNTDGTLDTTFDGDGKAVTAIGATKDMAFCMALQMDEGQVKIVVGGFTIGAYYRDFALVRYLPDGSLDPSFGDNGKVVTVQSHHNGIESIAIQPDGKILVGGATAINDDGTNAFAIVRYHPDGELDVSFAANSPYGAGWAVTPIHNDSIASLGLQADGKIVAAGRSRVADGVNYDVVVARYNDDGALDPTFDGDGMAITSVGSGDDLPFGVAVDPAGKIIVASYTRQGNEYDLGLLRYRPDGSLDHTFDGDGVAIIPLGAEGREGGGIVLQPDGTILAVGQGRRGDDSDFALVRYSAPENRSDEFLGVKTQQLQCLTFSPDSTRLAAGYDDGRVRLVEPSTGWGVEFWWGEMGVNNLAFSPDGSTLAVAEGSAISLWEVSSRMRRAHLRDHQDDIISLAFSPDGRWLASSDEEGQLILWSTQDASDRRRLPHIPERIHCLTWSSDGRWLVSGRPSTIQVWDAARQALVEQLAESARWAAFLKDGRLFNGDHSGLFRLTPLRATQGGETPRPSWQGQQGRAYGVSWSPKGEGFATVGSDGVLKIWPEMDRAAVRGVTIPGAKIVDFALIPQSDAMAALAGDAIYRIDAAGEAVPLVREPGEAWRCLACSSDGSALAATTRSGLLIVWDLRQSKKIVRRRLGDRDEGRYVAFSPDGRRLAVEEFDPERIVVLLDASNGKTLQAFPGERLDCPPVFSPQGNLLAYESDSTIVVWDIITRQKQASLGGHVGAVESLAFAPDGAWLASVGQDRALKVWDLQQGVERFSLSEHAAAVGALACSPDGRTLATGDEQGAVKLWSAVMGEVLFDVTRVAGPPIDQLAFSPDGRFLVWRQDNALVVCDAGRPARAAASRAP